MFLNINQTKWQGQRIAAILTIFLLSIQFGFSQNSLWVYGNKLINFSGNTVSASSLPQPGTNPLLHNTGQVATKGQTCQFDNTGHLLFFIIDGNIYDSEGYVIARGVNFLNDLTFDEDEPNQLPQNFNDLVITNVPGYCDKFYIFTATRYQQAQTMLVVASILDLTLPNVNFPGDPNRLGCLVSGEINASLLDGSLDYFFELDYNYAASPFFQSTFLQLTDYTDLKRDYHSMELIEISSTHKLLVISGRHDGIRVFNITNSNIAETTSCVLSDSDWGAGYYYGAVEAIPSAGGFKLAAIAEDCDTPEQTANNAISINTLSSSGLLSSSSLVVVGNQDNEASLVTSIEFSPDGNQLWFTKNNAPQLGVINMTDFTVSYPFTGTLTDYAYSELEGQTDENGNAVIYASTSSGIKKISTPNTPSSAVLSDVSWDSGTTPNSFAGGIANSTIYSLQVQNCNGQIIQTFLASSGCCHDYTELHFGEVPAINANNDGNWSNGNNPFNDQSSPIRITDDLTFPTGTNTIITNMVFEFDDDADVIIEKGAKVSLIGTTWTSMTCENIMWPGVDLFGTTDASSSIDQYPTINPDQGYLYLNNSIIENAMLGVDVGTTTDYKGGGIIKAYNSKFRNNQYDVTFRKYHYIDQNGNYVQNKSLFNNCTFITDAHLNNSGLSPATHVSLYNVEKIDFLNCSFMNTTALTTYNWVTRGTGIFASQASFKVDGLNDIWNGQSNDPDQTTFYKLRYGIRSFGSNNPLAFYTCKQQEFQQCLYGIINYNTDNVQIYQNNFQLPEVVLPGFESTMERGIYLTNSTGYTVEQNFFDGYNDPAVSDSYPSALGIWVENSGDFDNKIRNNDFDEMKLGTYVTKNNRYYVFGVDEPGDADDDGSIDQTGLQLFCNTYTNGQTDIFRDSETLMRQDQGGNQIDGTDLNAGNRFSAPDCQGAISDFVVDPDNNFYTYYHCHDQANCIPDCGGTSSYSGPGTSTVGMDLLPVDEDANNPYSDLDCPNTYGGPIIIGPNPGIIAGLVGQLQLIREELQESKDTYIQVVDNNQKQSTMDILSEAFPHESVYYRNILMQRYPLSDEVLKRLIIEASRLSSWHLTEIFLANSPLSKEVLYKLEETEILSSFFMSFLYNADSGASLRRLMELNMLSLATERDQLIQSIARAGLTYEADAESEADQLIYSNEYLDQLALQTGSTALRIRAAKLASNGDYAAAIAMVADEPLLDSYQNILQMEQSVSSDWSLLGSTQINALWDIYNSKKDYCSSHALSILQQIGVADFEPEPRVPIQHRSMFVRNDKDELEVLPLLGVWPNPACGSAWLHYPIEADSHATIEIFDPQGRLVNSFQPTSKGLVELSLKNYESGIYIVQLRAFDKVVESIKLTVINQN